VFRLFQIISPEQRVDLPDAVFQDMQRFLAATAEEPDLSLTPFGLDGFRVVDVVSYLRQVYQLSE